MRGQILGEEFIFRLTTYMPQMKNPTFREESEWRLLKITEVRHKNLY